MKVRQVVLIAVLLMVGAITYLGCRSKGTTKENGTALSNPSADTKGNGSDQSNNDTSGSNSSLKFDYVPEKVENGILYGVVEVGASGFNSFVINMDDKKRWEIVSRDFGKSLVYEGLATTEAIKAGLVKYRAAMAAKGVQEKNMYFVISSGAQKEPKTTGIVKELRSLGYEVNIVTPAQEAKYALKATLPQVYYDNSFMVDLGSGNTKISWDEEGTLKSMELPGSRYHEKGRSDEDVYKEAKDKISKLPPEKGDVCFIIGGVPHTLAGQHRKGNERYTVLKAPQDYNATDKKMASGLNIYKAILEGTRTDTYVFDWHSNFSIGFLLSRK